MAWRTVISFSQRAALVLFFTVFILPAFAQTGSDPEKLIKEAERVAWLKAWPRAAPLYAEAERLYAAEMVAAFASENGLATLIGVKTPGRLVATSAFKVGFGYRVVLPVAAYRSEERRVG